MRKVVLFFSVGAAFTAAGLVQPDDPIPSPGTVGAPHRALTQEEEARFLRGRMLFDRDFPVAEGVGPVMNGDSCRACHRDPVVAGGSGGIDVQVQRPAISDGQGGFVAPPETGDLAQNLAVPGGTREEIPTDGTVVFVEQRNSPTILGLGLVQTVSEATILSNEDPDDTSPPGGDRIRGVAHRVLPDGSIGRMGWKAQIPDLRGFLGDAMGNELGITVGPAQSAFGIVADSDGVADPEIDVADFEDILFYMEMLDFAPRGPVTPQVTAGEAVFETIGCAKCHIPVMDGVELYSNLLLHDVHPPGFQGVTQGQATSGLYRTAPLRGLRDTAPYFHDGRSETIEDAVTRHDGEALEVRQAYEALSDTEKAALLAFLESL